MAACWFGISLAQSCRCGWKGAGRVVECVRTLPGLLRSGWTVIVGFLRGLYSNRGGIHAAEAAVSAVACLGCVRLWAAGNVCGVVPEEVHGLMSCQQPLLQYDSFPTAA
jgi:hypothetical protein